MLQVKYEVSCHFLTSNFSILHLTPFPLSYFPPYYLLLLTFYPSSFILHFPPISPSNPNKNKNKKQKIINLSMAAVQSQPLDSEIPSLKSPQKSEHNNLKTEHIFKSRLPEIPIKNHLPLHSYLFENLDQFSERPCLISGSSGETFTYSQTYLLCKKTAVGLSKHGVKKGDTIMILLQNCPEFVFTFFGASMIGAVTTTANPFYTPSEIFKQINISLAKIIVTQSSFVGKLREIKEFEIGQDIKVITIDKPPEDSNCLHFSALSESDESELLEPEFDPNDPVCLPFSSGTTGLPKGVILTHKSLSTSVAQQVDGENPNMYLTNEDVLLCVLPLFHIFSLNSVLMVGIRTGSAILLMPKFEINSLLELIQRHRVSVAMVVPPLVLALAKNPTVEKYDLSSIRMVMSGAAPLGKELEDALRERIPQAVLGQVIIKQMFHLFIDFLITLLFGCC